ncbi:MAG: roadblock/LC7 domain-containing protein [Candidatus Helarchaeota archaeon]
MSEKNLGAILEQLDQTSGIIGSVIISYPQGIPLASTWKKEIESVTASGLVTSVKLTLDHLYKAFRRSRLSRIFVECDDGNFIIMDAGEQAIIIAFLSKYANIPSCAFDIRNASIKIKKAL